MITNYSADFYNSVEQRAKSSAEVVLNYFFEYFDRDKFKRSIDFGCGSGAWTQALLEKSPTHVIGFDLKESIEIVSKRLQDYVNTRLDLRIIDFSSDRMKGMERGDLGICLEVAEHLDSSIALKLIEWISGTTNVILFSAATPGQGGTGHINEQEHSYWLNQFRNHGFQVFDLIRPRMQNDGRCARFYALNIFVLVRQSVSLETYVIENRLTSLESTRLDGNPIDYRTQLEKFRYSLLKRIPHRTVTKLSTIIKT